MAHCSVTGDSAAATPSKRQLESATPPLRAEKLGATGPFEAVFGDLNITSTTVLKGKNVATISHQYFRYPLTQNYYLRKIILK